MFNNFGGGFNRTQPRRKELKKCDRCKLLYAKDSILCTHCSDLSDMQLADFLNNRKKDLKKTSSMGFVFFGILALLAIFVINNRALFGLE